MYLHTIKFHHSRIKHSLSGHLRRNSSITPYMR